MTNQTVQELILSQLLALGVSILAILASLSLLLVGFLVFKFGTYKLFHDRSLNLFGFYLRDVPYKGYNRFKSRSWNSKHTT